MTTPNANHTISISKEQLAVLPTMIYPAEVTVVDDPGIARTAVRALSRERIVGFDTETRPSFRKGQRHNVALMQISTHERCFLFRLNKIGISDGLKQFLENPGITKIGLSIHDDFNALHRNCEVACQGFIDLQQYVKAFGITDISLQKIYAIIFGERISKSQRLTNWEADTLTPGQQAYAALDAWACLKIYDHLRNNKFHPADSPYIHEASMVQDMAAV